jgi:uncharacterized protein YcfJ
MERNEELIDVEAQRAAAIPADRTARATDRLVDREIEPDVAASHKHAGHDDAPTVGDQVGEAAGGIGGVLAGAAIGSIGGPIGTVIGGIAGAIGGWWTGRAISEAASNYSHADDEEFRVDYETRDRAVASTPNRSYERVRPAYQLGYLASRNPEYEGRSFEDIEEHLERGWSSDASTQGSDWTDMRDYARTAYVRGAASQSSLTGDSSAKDSLSSTGSTGSLGTGSEAPHSEPAGTSRAPGAPLYSSSSASPVQPSNISSSQPRTTSMNQSSANDDAAARLASPKGSSFTKQGDVPLNSSATDTAGTSRAQDTEKQATQESGDLRGNEANRGPSFTDPVAGGGVENIGSSGGSPRGSEGTLNEAPRTDAKRPHEY